MGSGARVVGKVAAKIAEQPAVQATGRAVFNAVNATIEAQEKIDKKTQEWERKIIDSAAGKKVRQDLLGEDPRGKGPVQGVAIDNETADIAIYEETAWERRVRKLKESAFLGPIMGGTETALDAAREVSNRVGDRVFGETETALCMAEIKKDDPSFNTRQFLLKLENETIPFIMQCYLTDQLADMQDMLTERCVLPALFYLSVSGCASVWHMQLRTPSQHISYSSILVL